MTVSISKTQQALNSQLLKGGIQKTLEKTGKLPSVSLVVTPLEADKKKSTKSIILDRFLTYQFNSSMLIPVDTFSFTFAAPDGPPFYDLVKDGDMVNLYANDVPLSSGIIDTIEIETDEEFGEKITVSGRDLLSQFEDQDAISKFNKPIFAQDLTIESGVKRLMENTRMKRIELKGSVPSASNYILSTEPGESKLSALQRFISPANCLAWMGPSGQLFIGKPDMKQKAKATLKVSRDGRDSNVTHMKVAFSSTTIANIVVAIWSGQELVQDRVQSEQFVENAAKGPSRLRKLGHIISKSVVWSAPNAASTQGLEEVNRLRTYGSKILQANALREIARQNQREVIVQAVVPGHYNELGEPYVVDTVYHITYDRGSIDDDMYLFQTDYSGGEEGQKTSLYFCKLGSIVGQNEAPGGTR